MKSHSDAAKSWDKFLNPDTLKQNLVAAALYLSAFELLKNSLIGRPKDFFFDGYRDGKEIISPEYNQKVLSLHQKQYMASALWWKQLGAIADDDITLLTEIREHRNEIAHEMPKFIATTSKHVRIDLLFLAQQLIFKMDNWWIRNIEIGITLVQDTELKS